MILYKNNSEGKLYIFNYILQIKHFANESRFYYILKYPISFYFIDI